MARSIWKGSVTFGLVSIPVELFPAEDRREFKLSMLDKRDFSPVGYKRYSKNSGKDIAWSDIVKGYEYEKGQYVVLSEEDFRRANVKASRTIDIQSFVPTSDLPGIYYESPYYLAPGERGEKVYALLRETLRQTNRTGIGQFVLRSRQYLAAVTPVDRALVLSTLRYSNELRDTSGLTLPSVDLKEAGVTPKEIDLAKRLVSDMEDKWDPQAFRDTYHEDLMRRIEEKIKQGETQQITQPAGDDEEAPRSAQIIDLAALLQKSLGSKAKHGSRKQAVVKGQTAESGVKAAPKRKRA